MTNLQPDTSIEDGWTARLRLEYKFKNNRTVLACNRHSGPLVVQRSLYPENDVCHTYILHPPGGVVGGDKLEIDVVAGSETATLLTTPGATKFYRSDGKEGVQLQRLVVEPGGTLEWFPQENILFPGAKARIETRIDLADTARFMGWEILCLGLPTNKEKFTTGRADTALSLYRNGEPVFQDRLRVNGEKDLNALAGLHGFPVCATFIATGIPSGLLPALRQLVCREKKAQYGVTLLDDLLVARYLGYSTFAARHLFTDIWKILRLKILGKVASVPRIWAT
ncbi:MAG TPA: urease accessory protein [Desulfocapsa sulfexigens]|nr:urease accessory protein [Desulfocapsa sulfexigens]